MQRLVGLHFRVTDQLTEVIHKIEQSRVPIAQLFMTTTQGSNIYPSAQDMQEFEALRTTQLSRLIAHGSYRINLASVHFRYHPALEQEIYTAKKLSCTHFLLHPGAATDFEPGLHALARNLNHLIKKENDIQIMLENVAFAAPSIGGSFKHFAKLLEYIDQPDKLHFCVDTAHAYAAGYAYTPESGRENLFDVLKMHLGLEQIALLHLNDTTSVCGSHMDQHAAIGEGLIGHAALRDFALIKEMLHCPIILELPLMQEDEEIHILNKVQSWT